MSIIITSLVLLAVLVLAAVLYSRRHSSEVAPSMSSFFKDVFINEEDECWCWIPVEIDQPVFVHDEMYVPLYNRVTWKRSGMILGDGDIFIQRRDGLVIISDCKVSLPEIDPAAIVVKCDFGPSIPKPKPAPSVVKCTPAGEDELEW